MFKFLLTIDEAAEALRVSRSQIYALMASGALPWVNLEAPAKGKPAKLRRIRWADVVAYANKLDAQNVAGAGRFNN